MRALAEFETSLNKGSTARLKGVFRTDEGSIRLELAGGRCHEQPTGFRRGSQFDVIVPAEEQRVLDTMEEALGGALQTAAERAAAPLGVAIAGPDGVEGTLDRAAWLALPDGISDISELFPGRSGAAARLMPGLETLGATGDLEVVVVAADGYATPPVQLASLADAVILHSLDGGPLPRAKGGPFRLLVPGDAAVGGPCSNVKGVVKIALRIRGTT